MAKRARPTGPGGNGAKRAEHGPSRGPVDDNSEIDQTPAEGVLADEADRVAEGEPPLETLSEADEPDQNLGDVEEEMTEVAADRADTDQASEAETAPQTLETLVEPSMDPAVEDSASFNSNQGAPVAPPRKSGGMSALLGGVVAACLGGGAVYVLGQDGMPLEGAFGGSLRSELAVLQDEATERADSLAALDDRITALNEAFTADLTETATTISAAEQRARAALSDRLAALEAGFDAAGSTRAEELASLRARMDELERLPFSEAVSDTAIAAYERELSGLEASVTEARAELSAMMDASASEIETRTAEINRLIAEAEASRQEAARLEQAAVQAEQMAAAQGELNEIRRALSEGGGFAVKLAEIEALAGVSAPAALAEVAADGVTPQAALMEAFPALARDALAQARAETPLAEETDTRSRFSAFLDQRFQTRSVVPREGDDPDAVLSRAEAHVGNGDLDAALAELEALPEVALVPLAEWTAAARARAAALNALDALDAQLSSQQG